MSIISFSYLSAFTIILGFFVFLAILFVLNFIIKPLISLNFYKKQGIRTHFLSGMGWSTLFKKGETEHDDNLYFVKQNAKQNPDLDCEAYNVGPYSMLLIYSPKLWKPFLTNIDPYVKFKNLQPLTLYVKWGFTSLNGNIFRKHRGTVAGVFSYDILGERVSTMRGNARNACERIIKDGLNNVELIHYALDYAGDNVGDLFFGGHVNGYKVEGKSIMTYAAIIQSEAALLTRSVLLNIVGPGIVKLNLLPEHKRFNAKVRKLRSAVAEVIEDRKKQGDTQTKDLLKVLLETQKSTDPDVAYTDEMIFDEYVTLFAGGAENPAHTIVLALYLLNGHPEFKKRLLEEIKEVYDKNEVNTQTLHKLSAVNALIQETLRLHSPSFSTQPRISVKDFQLDTYKVKKGTIMMPVFFHQNYNEKAFDDAFKFKPERWLDGNQEKDTFKFIPFAAGPRNCIGQHFAMLEMKLMICEFLKKFDFEVSPGFKMVKTQRFLHIPREPVIFDLKVKA